MTQTHSDNHPKLIRGARIITASEDFEGEILVKDGKIAAVAKNLEALGVFGRPAGALQGLETIDAAGLLVFPGGIDPHTHLDLPFMGTSSADDFETGTIAALYGGTTSLIDFAIQSKGRPMQEALSTWHEKARGKAVIDYGFHIGVTDLNEKTETEIPRLVHEEGVTSFKCFMAYKGALMVDDGQLYRLFVQAKDLGALVSLHCENGELIDVLTQQFLRAQKTAPLYHELSHPTLGEGEATGRAAALSRMAGHPIYVVHLTCNEALEQVKQSALRYGHRIFAETCPQYLLLDRSLYESGGFEGAKWVMSPPLRTPADQEALWAALRDGWIQTIGTDHCPFRFSGQKDMGRESFAKIPNGIPAIEDRLTLLYTYGVHTNRISLNRFVELTSTNAARLFGLYPRKGTITPGADADLVFFDPKVEGKISAHTSHHRCDYSAFEGIKTQGQVVSVLTRGKFALKERKITVERGAGHFLKRNPLNTTALSTR